MPDDFFDYERKRRERIQDREWKTTERILRDTIKQQEDDAAPLRAGCYGCGERWTGEHARANASAHRKETRHETWIVEAGEL